MTIPVFDGSKLAAWKLNLSNRHADEASDVAATWADSGTAIALRAYTDDTSLTGNPRSQIEKHFVPALGDEYWMRFKVKLENQFTSPSWCAYYETYGVPYNGSPPWDFGQGGSSGLPNNYALALGAAMGLRVPWSKPVADMQLNDPATDIMIHSLLHTDPTKGYLELWVDGVQQLLLGVPRLFFATLDGTNWAPTQGKPIDNEWVLQVYHNNVSGFPNPVGIQYADFKAGPARSDVDSGTTLPPPTGDVPLASTLSEDFSGDALATFPAERRSGLITVSAGLMREKVSPTSASVVARSIDFRKFDGVAIVAEPALYPAVSGGTGVLEFVYPTISFNSRDGVEPNGNCRIVAVAKQLASGQYQMELRVVDSASTSQLGSDPTPYIIPAGDGFTTAGSLPVPLAQIKAIKTVGDTDGQTVRWLYSTNKINFSPLGIPRKFPNFNFAGKTGVVEFAGALTSPSSGSIAVSDNALDKVYASTLLGPNPSGTITPGDVWRYFGSNARVVMQADTGLLVVTNASGGVWLFAVGMRDAASTLDEYAVGVQTSDTVTGFALRVGKPGDTDADVIQFVPPGFTGGAAFGSSAVKWPAGVKGLAVAGCDASGHLSTHFINLDSGAAVHARDFTTISIPAAIPTTNAKTVIGGPRASNTTDAWHGFLVAAGVSGGVPSDAQVESMASVIG
jgi:hypothetical protein